MCLCLDSVWFFQLQDCATNSTWSLHAHAAQVPIERVWLRDCREDYVVQGTTVYYLQGASRVWHRGLVVEELPFAVLVEWPGNYKCYTT